jgi:hypothetical protein
MYRAELDIVYIYFSNEAKSVVWLKNAYVNQVCSIFFVTHRVTLIYRSFTISALNSIVITMFKMPATKICKTP